MTSEGITQASQPFPAKPFPVNSISNSVALSLPLGPL
jgi:hypothetical protein